jgi:hypothetical protein
MARDFSHHNGKNLSPCGKSSNRISEGEPYTFNIVNKNLKSFTGWLESSQINSGIVKTPFYFMRLSL